MHLNSQLVTHNRTTLPYYTKTDQKRVDSAKNILENIKIEAEDNDIITHEEHKAMCPNGKQLAKFYCNFNVHKRHDHGTTPPERPIVSGYGAYFETQANYCSTIFQKFSQNISHTFKTLPIS